MRRLLIGLVLPVALLAARAARAEAGLKIGYVDVQRAIEEVEEGKALRTRLSGELDSRRAQLQQKKTSLEKMNADYEKQAPVMNDEAKRKKQEELQKAYLEAQQSAGQMQQELSEKEREGLQAISKRIVQIVGEVSEREGFSFVIDKSVLLYAPAALDVTNEVVRRYNDRFKGEGKAAPAKSAQAPAGKAPPAPAAKK
jgi:outer membrane protein